MFVIFFYTDDLCIGRTDPGILQSDILCLFRLKTSRFPASRKPGCISSPH